VMTTTTGHGEEFIYWVKIKEEVSDAQWQ